MKRDEILQFADILFSGRYIESLINENLMLRISANQEIHFLTNRYSQQIVKEGLYMEFHLGPDGSFRMLGYPDKAVWKENSYK